MSRSIELLSDLVIKNVVSVSTVRSDTGAKNKRTNRSVWAIINKYEGETVYTQRDKKAISNSSCIVLLPMGSSYEWVCTRAGRFFSVEFECDTVCEEIFTYDVKNSDEITDIFRRLERSFNLGGISSRTESIIGVYSIIQKALEADEKKRSPERERKKILPAIEYILEHYNEDISNDFLAKIRNFQSAGSKNLSILRGKNV